MPNKDYFKTIIKSVSWIGNQIKTDRLHGYEYYKQCLVGYDKITLHDFVYVNNFDFPDNFENAYIAEIVELYDTGNDDGHNFCASVNWYTRTNEIKVKLIENIDIFPLEIFLNTMNYNKNIELESILAPAKVQLILNENIEPLPGNFIFTGRQFNGKKITLNKEYQENTPNKLVRSSSKRISGLVVGSVDRRKSILKATNGDLNDSNCKSKTTPKRRNVEIIATNLETKICKKLSFHQHDSLDNIQQDKSNILNIQKENIDDKMKQKADDCISKITNLDDITGSLEMFCDSSPVFLKNKRRSVRFQEEEFSKDFVLINEDNLNKLNFNGLTITDKSPKINTPRKSTRRSLINKLSNDFSKSDICIAENNFSKTENQADLKIVSTLSHKYKNIKDDIHCDNSINKNSDNMTQLKGSHSKLKRNKSLNGDIKFNSFTEQDSGKINTDDAKFQIADNKKNLSLKRTLSLRTPSLKIKNKNNNDESSVNTKSTDINYKSILLSSDQSDTIKIKDLDYKPSEDFFNKNTSKSGQKIKRSISINTMVGTPTLRPRTPKLYKDSDSDDDWITENNVNILNTSSDDYDDDLNNKKKRTPSRKNKDKSNTPSRKGSAAKSPRNLMIPSLPKRITKLREVASDLDKIRERLHMACVPDSMPGREDEFENIYQFVRNKIQDGMGGCMYVHGVPGTGKTATVRQVIKVLTEEVDSGDLFNFKYVEVNGMQVTEPKQINVHILKQLTGQKVTADHAAAILDKRFNSHDPHRDPIVLLVDELDMLWTKKQTIMYNIFDWPTKNNSKLIIITIANTMDLPERMLMARVTSRMGLTRLAFLPYNYKQLQEIILSRVQDDNFFDPDAVQLVARKVAAMSGDARRALEICRRATEMVSKDEMVTIKHVNDAIQDMFAAPKLVAIRNSSQIEKLFLQSLISEMQRTGIEEAIFKNIYQQFVSLCRFEGIQAPSKSQTFSILSRLSNCRIILSDNFKMDLFTRVRLNISMDDVTFALKG